MEPETNENEPESIVVAEEPTKQTEVEEVVWNKRNGLYINIKHFYFNQNIYF